MTTGFRYRFLPWSPSAPAQIASTPGPFPGARCADWQQAVAGRTSAGSPGHTTPEWRPWCLLRSDLTSTLLRHNKGKIWVEAKDLWTYKLTYTPVSGTSLKFWKNSCQCYWSNSKLIFIKLSNVLKSAYRGCPLPYSLFKNKNNKSIWLSQVELSCP